MISNNWQRHDIWLQMQDRFSFKEFTTACEQAGIEQLSILRFSHEAGISQTAITEFPGNTPREAYMALIAQTLKADTTGCSGCGASKGLGDTVAKITHATGLDKLSELYTKVTGKDCGCASRQKALNKLLPYNIKEEN